MDILQNITLHLIKGDNEKALELCNNVINNIQKPHPSFSDFYNLRGMINIRFKKYEEAFDDYNTAIKLNPYNQISYFNISIAKHDLGLYQESIEAFLQCSKLEK